MKTIIIAVAIAFMGCDEPIELTETNTVTETNTFSVPILTVKTHSNYTVNIKGTNYTFQPNKEISFYSNQNIRDGYLVSNVTVTIRNTDYTFISNDNIGFRGIGFYNNENIYWGTLVDNVTVDIGGTDYTFQSNSIIQFHTTEAIIQGKLESETGYTRFYTDGTTNAVKLTTFNTKWTGER